MHQSTHAFPDSRQRSRPVLSIICVLLLMLSISPMSSALAADAANRQQAIDKARQQNGGNGKVLGVQTSTNNNGQTVFAVKILSNGRVRVFRFTQAN